jgi:transketolase
MNQGPPTTPPATPLRRLRETIVRAAANAREGHIASAFSILDILWVLYDRVLRFNPADPRGEERDRFVLSKGHASLALYAVLADKGFFPPETLLGFGGVDSPLGGHPDCRKVPGVEASTGSLGHGLPMAVGIALALRLKRSDRRVFALVGDGECNEGAIWEAALLASHHRLANLTCIVDYNHSTDRALLLGDVAAKFAAFGWSAEKINGHDHAEIERALTRPAGGLPAVVVAETIKGFGCKPMEGDPSWHHRAPTPAELPGILAELR